MKPSVPSKTCSVVSVPPPATLKTVPAELELVRPVILGGAVEHPVGGLNQSAGWVCAVLAVEARQPLHCACRSDLEDRSPPAWPPFRGGSIKVAAGPQNQSAEWEGSVAIQDGDDGYGAGGADLKDCAVTVRVAAVPSCPIEVSIDALS